jgi:hydroxymethylbilane synthase
MKEPVYKKSPGAKRIRLIGRNSRLSLLQIKMVKQKIQSAFPGLAVEVIARSSRGDALQEIPLHTVEGSDFFTQDIFDALAGGEADIAVHSLKDMSGEHFFGENYFAVVDRDDTRDVVIFNKSIEEKLKKGETIIVGTCSPRREEMAAVFLKKALPQLHSELKIATHPIRGNVETRLRKLDNGEYDATILATAGINRLLRSDKDAFLIQQLLAGKKLMLLPLIDCVPAPCQGAIVAEAHHANNRAVEILKAINNESLYADCYAEKREAGKYGTGCIQKFGVTTLNTRNKKYLYAAGRDSKGILFENWNPLPDQGLNSGNLFSTTEVMKDFFEYQWDYKEKTIESSIVFIANYKYMKNPLKVENIRGKTILASGTKTWMELAKMGYWVTASADALGFESLLSSLKMPLFNFQPTDIMILTHQAAAERWKRKGFRAESNSKLVSKQNKALQRTIESADAIFWSSYSQFEFYGQYAKPGTKHMCCGGETAELLKQAGIAPVIFPTIKSFQQWRNSSIPSHSVA